MKSINLENSVIVYGEHTVDLSTLPEVSIRALTKRGLTHFLGSEMSSKAKGWFDNQTAQSAVAGSGVVAPTEETKAAFLANCITEGLAALYAGTVGVSNRGPSVDPVTAIARGIARREVLEVLKNAGVKVPKKSEDKVTFADGSAFTIAELTERRQAKSGARIMDEAKKHKAELDRKSKKIAAAAQSADKTAGAEALDL
jgi:hypothetical protein